MIASRFDTSHGARYGEAGRRVRRADHFPTAWDDLTIIACKITDRPTWWNTLTGRVVWIRISGFAAAIAAAIIAADAAAAESWEEKIGTAQEELHVASCEYRKVTNDPSATAEQAQVASMKVQHAEREIVAKHGRTIAEQAAMILAAEQPPRPCPSDMSESAIGAAWEEKIEAAQGDWQAALCEYRKVTNDQSATAEQAQVASMKVQHAEREIIAKHGRTIAEQAAMILAAAQPPRPCPK